MKEEKTIVPGGRVPKSEAWKYAFGIFENGAAKSPLSRQSEVHKIAGESPPGRD